MQTRIKFCGMTSQQDVQNAIALGVDALGFVFVQESSRNLSIEHAKVLLRNIPPFVVKVGLFMDTEAGEVQNVLAQLHLDLLQFHGEESENFCKQFVRPYLKAVPMSSTVSATDFCANFPSATGFVLDSHGMGQMGGSGEVFDWSKIPQNLDKPMILAGGLEPNNVAEAIRAVRPYAVDVSSGIEASKGIKDLAKMEHFVKEVRSA